ncbi:MAG: hypothetical protein JXA94_07365 [Parachlamydiales bacterium]|nr:hypothetical protein [Parachlamydiales bacterium]
MHEFNKLLDIADALLGQNGCTWDKKQTFNSIKNFFLEESYELIDAIEKNDYLNMQEEAADLLYSIIFLCKIAEKEKKFTIKEVLQKEAEKLIRRHPHVFGNIKIETDEDILKNWEKIKKEEKNERKNLFDDLPGSMDLIMKAQKVIKRLKDKNILNTKEKFETEKELEDELINIISKAVNSNFNVFDILKSKLNSLIKES